jgi:hypothetical protein
MDSDERTLTNKFYDYLDELSYSSELKTFLINIINSEVISRISIEGNIHQFLQISGKQEIDIFISYGNKVGISTEIKDKWKTSPGQLKSYYQYSSDNYTHPFLIFITQSPDDIYHPRINTLFKNPNWYHITWNKIIGIVNNIKGHSTKRTVLIDYLISRELDKEVSRNRKEYNLRVHLPESYAVKLNTFREANYKRNKPLASWSNREMFWTDVTEDIENQTNSFNYFCYRRDLYHYILRWAFNQRNVLFEMEDDNYWEWYIEYYENNIKNRIDNCEIIKMRKLYNEYLKIYKKEYILLNNNKIVGVESINNKDCYIVTNINNPEKLLKRIYLFEEIPF